VGDPEPVKDSGICRLQRLIEKIAPTQKPGLEQVIGQSVSLGRHGRQEISAGIKAFGGKKCGACLHVATLPATDWVLIGSVNPTSPGGRRPPLAEPPEAALLPERPAVR